MSEPVSVSVLLPTRRGGALCERVVRRILRRVGLDCSPGLLLSRLTIGYQQMVEIAKALSANARILIC